MSDNNLLIHRILKINRLHIHEFQITKQLCWGPSSSEGPQKHD